MGIAGAWREDATVGVQLRTLGMASRTSEGRGRWVFRSMEWWSGQ